MRNISPISALAPLASDRDCVRFRPNGACRLANRQIALPLSALCLVALGARPCAAQTASPAPSASAKPAPAKSAVSAPTPVVKSVATLAAEPEAELPPDTPRIGQIVVIGNKTLSQTAIILFSGHNAGDACIESVLSEIRANIFQKGYFGMHSASVDDAVRVHVEPMEDRNPILAAMANSVKDGDDKDKSSDKSDGDAKTARRYKIVIEVDENDVVKNAIVEGNGPVKEDDIKPLLHVKPGMVYNPFQFRRDCADIQDLYNKRGYAVTPDADAGIDGKGNLNVKLVVARVSDIKVAKNHKTRPEVITRELKTKKGDYYNRATVQRDRVAVYNTELFEDVTVEERSAGPGKIALVYNVPEKKTGQVLGGLSYSASGGPVGTASIVEHNFRGRGETLSLTGALGTSSFKQHTIDLNYLRPWVDKKGTKMDLSLYDKNVTRFADGLQNGLLGTGSSIQNGRFSQQRTGASVAFTRPLSDTLRVGLNIKGEDTRTDPLSDLSGFNSSIVQNGPIFQVGGLLQNDTRDFPADAVTGGYQSLTLALGHASLRPVGSSGANISGVFGSGTFGKSSLELRQYYSLTGPRNPNKLDEDKTSLAMRLMAGSAVGKLPFAEQFFLGGIDTLRGYKEDRFWGNYMMAGTLELRQPLARKFKGVLFVDVGNTWGGDYRAVNLSGFAQGAFQPHIGAGIGLRIGTPIGPIRLDLGFGQEGARGHVGIGRSF